MSQETSEWLNRMILVGYTDKRGTAWHYRVEDQGEESNHYPGAVPVADVMRRLFNFGVIEAPVYYRIPCDVSDPECSGLDEEGKGYKFVRSAQERKGMLADDNLYDFGAFKSGYTGHPYQGWLVDNLGVILDQADGELGIGSAGLLRSRGQAFVTVEVPENITTAEGVEFRPHLLASTSFDGSLATTYKRVVTEVVCDNTRDMALGEEGQEYKVKHSKYSNLKIASARDALAIVFKMADDFAAEVATLCAWGVSEKQFAKTLDTLVPEISEEDSKKGATQRENKRAEIINLYTNDNRCAPWNGTAFGVLQAFNTWNQHYSIVRKGAPRYMRHMENVLMGKVAASDAEVLTVLSKVTRHNPKVAVAI